MCETLEFFASSSDTNIVNVSITQDTLFATSSEEYGIALVYVTGVDQHQASVFDTVRVQFSGLGSNETPPSIPRYALLRSNTPNPFREHTKIKYFLPRRTHVRLSVFDVLGRKIGVLVDEHQPAGEKALRFIADDVLPSGVYFYRLKTGAVVDVGTMVHIK